VIAAAWESGLLKMEAENPANGNYVSPCAEKQRDIQWWSFSFLSEA